MNVVEQMMMNSISHAVQSHSDPIDAASTLGMRETLDMINSKCKPEDLHALVVLGVRRVEPNADGEPGIELVIGLCGSPAVLHLLGRAVQTMVVLSQMENTPEGQLLNTLFGNDSALQSEKCNERYSGSGKPQH